jgi:hypothetical protein
MSLISEKFLSAVNRELELDESVCWADRPNSFYSIQRTIALFLFGIPWNISLLFALTENFSEEQPTYIIILVMPFCLIGIYLFLSPLLEWRKARNSLYVISNQRAFTIQTLGRTSV